MLVEFNVTNFRSFKDTQTLSMVCGSSKEKQEANSFVSSDAGLPRLLRSAVIYGPNAAGKSNLLQAISFMRDFVLSSAQTQEGDKIGSKPFLLNQETKNASSEFEVVFFSAGVRYQYGFAVNQEMVTKEWLFAYPESRAQRWFERSYDINTKQESWYFGSKFIGQKKIIQLATRKNALFLSTAIQLNNKTLKPVFGWFKNLTVILHNTVLSPGYSIDQCLDDACTKDKIKQFMNAADISIKNIVVEKKQFSPNEFQFPSNMPPDVREDIIADLDGEEMVKVSFLHSSDEKDGVCPLPLEEESDGTQKLFAYAGPWLDLLANGRVLLIDELNNSFHPHMVKFLIELIHSSTSNSKNGQVVFTTHDTSILDQKFMRRDQIWFVEKDQLNASNLYPLSDFSPRKDESIGRNYLWGKYGALPFIDELDI